MSSNSSDNDLDCVPITVVRLNRQARITHVNEAWRKFARENGASQEAIQGVGLNYLSALPDTEQPLAAALSELLAGRQDGFTCVYPCHSPTEVRWFRMDAVRAPSDDEFVVLHTNITDFYLAEARLALQSVVAQALTERAPLSATCRRMVRAVCDGLEWDFAAIWLQGNEEKLTCHETWIRPGLVASAFEQASRNAEFALLEGLPGRVWESRTPEWIDDVSSVASFRRASAAAEAGLRTGFAVPLGADGEVFAVIEFYSVTKRAPDLALMELLATSGAQLGVQVLRERAEERASEAEAAERKASAALRERDERFRQILDAIPDLVLVKGPESRILWANAAFRELYGMSNDVLQGLIDAPFVEPDYTQQYIRDDALVFSSGKTLEIPNEPVTGFDGKVGRFRTTKSPIFDDSGNVVMTVGVSQDITNRVRLEAQVQLADRLASVGTLASGIAHEINTPVQFVNDSLHFLRDAQTDIFSVVATLQEVRRLASGTVGDALDHAIAAAVSTEEQADLPYLHENIPKAFERCIDGLDRVSTIVRSMKEFAHPAHHDMAPVDLNRAIQNTLAIATGEYKYLADLVLELAELPSVVCYVNDINQVVLNLIVNAAHAISEVAEDSESRGTLTVRTRRDGDHVEIAIGDTGGGIPYAIAHRIFEPFFTTKDVGKGTGQGLALAWAVVTGKHGGELRFETKLGVGSTFFIRLPIAGKV